MNFRADLHCHTTWSDGTLSPRELFLHAQEVGLQGICITDHDTVGAYPEAIRYAKEFNIRLGAGVEFSSFFRGMSVHILGYDFTIDHAQILSLCARHEARRKKRNTMILDHLERLGMPVYEEELQQFAASVIGRPHIAQLMCKKGYVKSVKEAFQLYLGDKKACYHPGEVVLAEETIEIIHAARGKAFIAHPHLLRGASKMKELFQLPFDGVECYYARFAPSQEVKWIQKARQKGWLISGGSDFHRKEEGLPDLGCSWVDKETFDQIFTNPLL